MKLKMIKDKHNNGYQNNPNNEFGDNEYDVKEK